MSLSVSPAFGEIIEKLSNPFMNTNLHHYDKTLDIVLSLDKSLAYATDSGKIQFPTECYRPSSRVMVSPLCEHGSILPDDEALLEGHLLEMKAGCLGDGRGAVSLPSMNTTLDIVGLSLGSSCMQSSPTIRHLVHSFALQRVLIIESTNSRAFPSFHNSHACRAQKHFVVISHSIVTTNFGIQKS